MPIADAVSAHLAAARARLDGLSTRPVRRSFGRVESVGDGVASVRGLAAVGVDEALVLGDGVRGLAVALDADRVGVMLLDAEPPLAAGERAEGTGDVLRIPVGPDLLGRVLDPLGRPLDGGEPPAAEAHVPIDVPSPPIVDRGLVDTALHTGLLVVDATIPLGRGQRQLVIGDRKTGKTALALDVVLAQRDQDVLCVWCAIGQQESTVALVIEALEQHGMRERTVVVVGDSDAAPGLQWLAPFSACAVAERLRDAGRDVLVVYDDLTRHAAIHRQIGLLLRDPPGREAYPADIFHVHARLLERATRLSPERGGGSITALPIAETRAGNLTAYIPTNLVSITDGQLYLEPRLFNEGLRPAVEVGLSVSRVGGRTQPRALAHLSASLRLRYAQFVELEMFTRFGSTIDERTRKTIAHGQRIRAALVQPRADPLSLAEEVALLLALEAGLLDDVPLDDVPAAIRQVRAAAREEVAPILAALGPKADLGEPQREGIVRRLTDALATLRGA